MSNIAERQKMSTKRAALLREFADRQFSQTDMLEIFGRALLAKAAKPTERHNMLGKNYFNSHQQKHKPAGFKLLRKWYAKSGKMFTGMELRTGETALCRFKEGTRDIVVQVN